MTKLEISQQILEELERANSKYESRFHSMNEALGTVYAEFCEMRNDIVGHEPVHKIRSEAVQVAAMCVKLIQFLDGKSNARL